MKELFTAIMTKYNITISTNTIAFNNNGASPDTITDSASGFVTAGFSSGMQITVSGSTSNNGTYTISTVEAGVITLIASDSLTTEIAGSLITINTALKGATTGLFLSNAPQNQTYDYIVYSLPTGSCQRMFNNGLIEETQIQFNAYSDESSPVGITNIFEYIKNLFDDCELTFTNYTHIRMKRDFYLLDFLDERWQCTVQYSVQFQKN